VKKKIMWLKKKKKKKVEENKKNKRLVCLYEEKSVISVKRDDKMQFVVLVRVVFFGKIICFKQIGKDKN